MPYKILFSFLILLLCFSCSKDETLPINEIEIPEVEFPTPTTPIDNTNSIFKQSVVETQTAFIETMVTIVKTAMVQPGLYGLQQNTVDTRSCPNTNLTDNGGDGFDKTLQLLFNELGTNCTVGGITYSGEVIVEFEAALGDTDADDSDIQLSALNSFVVNGFAFTQAGGTIDLEQSASSPYGYDFTIVGAPFVATKGDISTSVPVGATGTFEIEDEGEDPANPALWFDNPFSLTLNDAMISCINNVTGASASFCVDTEEEVKFSPQICSCPLDGIIRIKDNNGDCTTPITVQNSSRFDFGDGTCANAGSVTEQVKVIEFWSYDGNPFEAKNNFADGAMSVDVNGLVEDNSTLPTESLQRIGSGSFATDFTWTGPVANSPGALNAGQTLVGNSSSLLPWINEFHYFDNAGGGANGFIEIAGPAGTDLSQYELVLYNGSSGNAYGNVVLTGVIDDEGNGFGALDFQENGIQNANGNAADGIALVKLESTQPLNFCN